MANQSRAATPPQRSSPIPRGDPTARRQDTREAAEYAGERKSPSLRHMATLADGHWMTSSARVSTDGGIVRPRDFAVLRLMTSSKVVGCWTGRSAGLAPLRTFPAYA